MHSFHHFHSNTREALGVYSGEVTVEFGGEGGVVLTARSGDVVVLAAGTGHRKLRASGALGVVGAYPSGANPDMCIPQTANLRACISTVGDVMLPACDPVCGADGPLFAHWTR